MWRVAAGLDRPDRQYFYEKVLFKFRIFGDPKMSDAFSDVTLVDEGDI